MPHSLTQSETRALKSGLRRQLRARRRELEPAARARFDVSICAHIEASVTDIPQQAVAGYWPMDGEPDLRPLLTRWQAQGASIALPVIGTGGQMHFALWTPGAELAPNRFGIPEPADSAPLKLADMTLVLMPLVGFSLSGGRLGMGGGFYDRALMDLKDKSRPLRVGIAYQAQEAGDLPIEAWDVNLHSVATEKGWFTCSP